MNPISFVCTHCSRSVTVAPDAAGRAAPCPHCKQVILVPALATALGTPTMRVPGPATGGPPSSGVGGDRDGDQGPDFTETLRKAREETDSIFHDHDDGGDSLFGGGDTPRKPIAPSTPLAMSAPQVRSDPSQPTMRVPGLPSLPPIAKTPPPPAVARPVYAVPVPTSANPFADLSDELPAGSPEGADADGGIDGGKEEDAEAELEDAAPRRFPWKNLIIALLTVYALAMTAIAAWGWLRNTDAGKGVAPATPIRR